MFRFLVVFFVLCFNFSNACVTYDKSKGTYTVDPKGHVNLSRNNKDKNEDKKIKQNPKKDKDQSSYSKDEKE